MSTTVINHEKCNCFQINFSVCFITFLTCSYFYELIKHVKIKMADWQFFVQLICLAKLNVCRILLVYSRQPYLAMISQVKNDQTAYNQGVQVQLEQFTTVGNNHHTGTGILTRHHGKIGFYSVQEGQFATMNRKLESLAKLS